MHTQPWAHAKPRLTLSLFITTHTLTKHRAPANEQTHAEEDFLLWEPIKSPSSFSRLLHVGAVVPGPWASWPASRAFLPEPQPLPQLPPLPPPLPLPPCRLAGAFTPHSLCMGLVQGLARAALKERTTQVYTQVRGMKVHNQAVTLQGLKCKITNARRGAEPRWRGRSRAGLS